MATVVETFWINPLNGSHILPTSDGELITAAVAYHEDQLNEWRPKRPRKDADKQEKQRRVEHATERLTRFAAERDALVRGEKLSATSRQLAHDDLSAVMKVSKSSDA